jgi:type IV pilus assembly protein PilE
LFFCRFLPFDYGTFYRIRLSNRVFEPADFGMVLAHVRRRMTSSERASCRGFTLIELLVVVAIVAILSSIAITQYALYKQKAVDAQMESTLHEARQAMEAYYVTMHTYVGATEAVLLNTYGYKPSTSMSLSITPPPTDTNYALLVCAAGGTTPAYAYSSTGGSMFPDPGPCT